VDTYVAVAFDATWPDAAGTGQENSLVSHPAGDLHAPVLVRLAESPLYVGGETKEDIHVVASNRFAPCSGAGHPASPPCPEGEAGVVQEVFKKFESHAHSS
jgi:hypothetical protein